MPTNPLTRIRPIEVLALLGIGGFIVALVAPAILAAREAARRSECVNNLKQLSLGVRSYADTFNKFPLGTSGSRDLSPDQRFSWYPPLWHFLEGKPPKLLVDENQAWDAEVNRSPKLRYVIDFDMPTRHTEDRPLPHISLFGCPSASPNYKVLGIQVTQYIGMAGLGVASPELTTDQTGAGIWGYDRQIRLSDIVDGASSTILLAETSQHLGPWIAGGPPTVRGFDPKAAPFFGVGGQYGGVHSVCPTALADGSIRQWDISTDEGVFAAMVTVAGRD